ncbi:MAG TPA: MlaD family protein [Candidatus Binataceae bacterium]
MFRITLGAFATLLVECIFACGSISTSGGVPFNTQLTSTGKLDVGSAVMMNGARVGAVTRIGPPVNDKTPVSFEVDPAHADQVHTDSIAALRVGDTGTDIEIVSANTSSEVAKSGATLPGASNSIEEAVLLGSGQINGLIQNVQKAMGLAVTGLHNINNSPEFKQFNENLKQAQNAAQTAGEQGRQIAQKQLPELEREMNQLQRELEQEGNRGEAKKLRDQLDAFANSLAAPVTPTPAIP